MDKEVLEKIKKNLSDEKTRLEKELKEFAHKDPSIPDNYKSDFPNFGNDDDENANEVAEYTDRLSLEHTLEKELRDVNKAIEKIEKDDYGKCKYCKEEINKERLIARPTSTSCVACKKKLKGEL